VTDDKERLGKRMKSFESPEAGGTTRVLAWAGRWGGLPGCKRSLSCCPWGGNLAQDQR
ncbi:hypothetical protein XENOCAPTIV_021867, partial [Xenoophorus captivus]